MHEIPISRLSDTTRDRLEHAINNDPPFAAAGSNTGSKFGRIFLMLLGAGGVVGVAAIDYGSPFHGIQELPYLAGYAVSLWILIAQIIGWMRDARKKAATTLPQGMWVIALDLVEIDGGTLRVWPLSDMVDLEATHQHYNGAYSYTEFVFKFPETSKRFVIGNQAGAELAMNSMQNTRQLVSVAVQNQEWETVVALDPLFELRTNDWEPQGTKGPELRGGAGPMPVWMAKGKTAALVAGVLLGGVVMMARNYVSDGAAFEEAKRWNETWAWQGYLRQNGRYSDEVKRVHLPLAQLAEWEKKGKGGLSEALEVAPQIEPLRTSEVAEVKAAAEKTAAAVYTDALDKATSSGVNALRQYRDELPDPVYTKQARERIHTKYEEAKASFKEQASTADANVVPFFMDLLTRLEKRDDPRVYVRFKSPTDALLKMVDADNAKKGEVDGLKIEPVASHFSLKQSAAREKVIRDMMSKGFRAVLPNDVLDLVVGPRLDGDEKADGPSIEVRYIISPSGAIYSSSNPVQALKDKRGFVGISVSFQVAMKIPKREGTIDFELKVEPPEQFSVSYRSAAFMAGVGGGASTSKVYSVMAARAFEKLADALKDRIFAKDSAAFKSFEAPPPPPPKPRRKGLPAGLNLPPRPR